MAEDGLSYKVVVIGGSAGSLELVLKITQAFPLNSGAIFIAVVHRKSDADSILASLLASRTLLPVREVEDKETIQPNTVYLAPPDYHLLVEDRLCFSLDRSEKIHYSRPSIDVTFESVAHTFGAATIAVLLSGANADGAEGMLSIKQAGGITLVQDPSTAEVAYMPQQAIRQEAASHIIAADELPGYIRNMLEAV
ncbi:MAG: chemotaxis protein CheB [Bacteroidota bacterium]